MRPPASTFAAIAAACIALALAVGVRAGVAPAPAHASLESRIAAAQAKENALGAAAHFDSQKIAGLHVRVAALQERENQLQAALNIQQGILNGLQQQLRDERARLVRLRRAYQVDQNVLARQLRGAYETQPPDVVTVLMSAHGFAQLLETVDLLKRLGHHNALVYDNVRRTRDAVTIAEKALAGDEQRQRQVTAAAASERDQAGVIRVAVLSREMTFVRARDAHSAQLGSLRAHRAVLEQKLAHDRAAAAQAQALAFGAPLTLPGFGGGGTGTWGFFQAPGTNYSVGSEPVLAARLDTMGKALHIHLIGISGYRTPQHSVEVGGFANDPHTRGEASDTPGVEGVPEGTLEGYGLTRPFGGAAEADHIQLFG